MQILRCRALYNPPRKKELNAIKQEISRALENYKKVGLIGLPHPLTDYPFAKDVLKLESGFFSSTSLRASRKSAELAGLLKGP